MKPPKRYNTGGDELEPETTISFRLLRIPDIDWVWGTLRAVLSELTYSSRWKDDPFAAPIDQATQIFQNIIGNLSMPSPLLGTICHYITDAPPDGVLPLDGTTHARADYPQLWAALDPSLKFGDTFTLPNANGRFLLGGSNPTAAGGSASVTLGVEHMPAHSHDTLPHSHGEVTALPNATTIGPGAPQPTALPGVGTTAPSGVTVLSSGGGLPHDNMPPYTTVKMGVWFI